MNKKLLPYLLGVVSAFAPLAASSQVIVRHTGGNNPVSEGFTLDFRRDVQLGQVNDDQGRDAWKIHSRNTGEGAYYFYNLAPNERDAALQNGLSITASMRFVELSDQSSARLTLFTGSARFGVRFSAISHNEIVISGDGITAFSHTVDPLIYNEFALLYDAALETVSFWVNGAAVVTGVQGFPTTSAMPRVYFGNSAESITYSHWHEVTVAIIPEPAVVGVGLGLGALTGALVLRRRRENPHGISP